MESNKNLVNKLTLIETMAIYLCLPWILGFICFVKTYWTILRLSKNEKIKNEKINKLDHGECSSVVSFYLFP